MKPIRFSKHAEVAEAIRKGAREGSLALAEWHHCHQNNNFSSAAKRVIDIGMIVPLSKVQLRQDEDGVWIAKSSLLPGCHAHGRDRGEAALRFQQAAKAHLEALLETGRPIPPAFRDRFVLAA